MIPNNQEANTKLSDDTFLGCDSVVQNQLCQRKIEDLIVADHVWKEVRLGESTLDGFDWYRNDLET